jgi:hypothetical protein
MTHQPTIEKCATDIGVFEIDFGDVVEVFDTYKEAQEALETFINTVCNVHVNKLYSLQNPPLSQKGTNNGKETNTTPDHLEPLQEGRNYYTTRCYR